ncbi:MAG: hypothetical protein KF859_11645 [Phycisphaeraceae bacterium]|nr:hypothetical protein [Phycisphaeraceae bacterium]
MVARELPLFAAATLSVFLAMPISQASAQIRNVEPYQVVTTDKAALRSGDSDLYYKIADLAAETRLTVDGEGGAWSRVSFPANVTVFVKAEQIDVSGNSGKLTTASRLLAPNLATGIQGSWKALLAAPLPTGSTLRVVEPIREADGPIVGYRVVAPEQARAFVETRFLRRVAGATPATTPSTPTTPTTTPQPVPTPTPTPTPAPAATDTKPAEAVPAQPQPAPIDLTQPMAPGTDQATPTMRQPEAQPATDLAPSTLPNAPTTTPSTTPATPANATPAPRPVGDLATLERTFREVWRQSMMESEMDELLAEYQVAINATRPGEERLRDQLQQRADALSLRIALRDRIRQQEADRAALDQGQYRVQEQLAIAAQARVYTIVGQLQPSTVYDGQRLPLMYRVVSVGGTSPRTLGYLRDDPQFGFQGKLGQVVGVIGEANLDRSLMLNIIRPVRVDVLGVQPTQPTPATQN